jgi:hypothetical protein
VAQRNWWLVTGSLKTMTAVWMGLITLKDEMAARRVLIDGDPAVRRSIQGWLKLRIFAPPERKVA